MINLNDKIKNSWLEQIFNNTSVAVLVVDKDRKILGINEALCRMWDYAYDELINQSAEYLHVSSESYLNFGEIAFQKVLKKVPLSVDYQFKRKDGSLFWANISGDPIHSHDEVLWMITNISRRVKTANLIDQSQTILFYWRAEENWPVEYVSKNISSFGYTTDEFLSGETKYSEIIHPDDLQSIAQEVEFNTENHIDQFSQNYRVLCSNGEIRWIDDRTVIERNSLGEAVYYLGTITDITAEKTAEKNIKKQHLFLQNIIDGVTDKVMVINNDYSIALMNQSARSLIDNKFIADINQPKCYEISHRSSMPCNGADHPCPLALVQNSGKTEKVIHQHFTNNDSIQIVELIATPLKDDNDKTYAIIESAHDITGLIEVQNKLQDRARELNYKAHYDALTGLSNRTLLMDRLSQAIKRAHRQQHRIAVFFIDLDHFKEINDSLGHSVGDLVLKEASLRLQASVRDMDTVSRLGGDEFTIILDKITDTDVLPDITTKIIHKISQPILIDMHKLYITTSIGISLYPDDGDNVEVLLRNADAAMYKAKNEGRNTYQYYTEELTQKAFEHISLESNLRHALQHNELVIYYQPQVNTQSQQIIGMEALVRWDHPEAGIISPAQFIPLAEKTGLIIPLGEQVLRIATRQMAQWMQHHPIDCRMAINLSVKQLQQKDIVDIITNILSENKCKPQWIELEITEGYIMTDPDKAIHTLEKLQKIGITIAIDDFGTGYSSLSYLKRLPINKLKIDQSFIRDLNHDEDDKAIVISIIALAKSMKLNVIAEGVEIPEQSHFLQKEGCTAIQGYLYSRPVPEQEMTLLLASKTIDISIKS
ncbi:MAG: EAL domain-containing protein [Gammaproteobacteria bacterium]|nr:EAL domain-containing protein [Gammaproteobacteria bacterium]